MEKLKQWIRRKWAKIRMWWHAPYDGFLSNGDVTVGSFLAGSGRTFWIYVIVFWIYCTVTGSKLDFVKK